MATINKSQLHSTILSWIIEHGFAQTVEELSKELQTTEEAVVQTLLDLQAYHGVVLHPHRPEIWVIHPFSTAPTTFLLQAEDRKWWSNCAWCALGAAALLDRKLSISTLLGAETEQVTIHVENGRLIEEDYCVHFPVPMRHAWDNVLYTCSTMLLFRKAVDVDEWCRRHRIARGDVQPVAKVAEFAKVWYGNHLSPEWTKWTTQQAQEIFDRFGFHSDIWQLPKTDKRF